MERPANRFQDGVLDALNAGMIVLDHGRRIVGWNAWMTAASGCTQDAVQGKTLQQVFPDADMVRLDLAIGSALETGVSSLLTHALHPRLIPLKTRAGREMLHDVTVSAVAGAQGPECLIHVGDVTMAVRRERYLRDRQKARYDAVVANAPDAILTLDIEGAIRLANQAAIAQFGYAEEELTDHQAAMLFESPHQWEEIWRGVLTGGKPLKSVELVVRRKDGSLAHYEISASRWQNESHAFVTAILRDVSERRAVADALASMNATLELRVAERTTQLLEVEEALRQSQKMEAIGQLTGGIAHDFNNLLQGIIGALNMVQKRTAEGRISDIDRFLKGAVSSAERASSLTHRLLAFSRRQPIAPRPIDINHLIGTIEELLRRTIGEKIRMNVSGAEDLWLVRCDGNQLENALLNLAINARDAMPDGGTLAISTTNRVFDSAQALVRDIKPGEYACLLISDTGVGMPPDVQARAFDPFYTTKPLGKGTGLGLSMIYGFVRQSEGAARITSAVGKGTTIELCLPRYNGDLAADVAGDVEATDDRTGHNEIVLVAEDEEVVRFLAVEVLNDLGYRVLEAGDGPSALRILQSSQKVDLLVTDIGLPDINGRQVADAARTVRPNLKVLFMTGYAESAANSEFLEPGMQLITKPFTMDKLAAKIHEMFELP